MKTFTILAVNTRNGEAIVMGSIDATNEKSARIAAFQKYYKYIEPTAENLVVASKNRHERFYRNMVERTDAIMA